MDNKKYAFAGNRACVLQKMIEMQLNVVKIWAVENSYLQKYLEQNNIPYSLITSKNELVNDIKKESFDYFISNGLPIILPVDELKTDEKKFINIHPSLLPDLRGRDPIPGALLFSKRIGTTCHYMNKEIDSGDIIEQVEIDNTPDLDAGLLYQLSFLAEAQVFEKAYRNGFKAKKAQVLSGNEIYYSFKKEDLEIDLEKESPKEIVAKVKAFATRNKKARIIIDDKLFQCIDAEIIVNKYLQGHREQFFKNKKYLTYENKLLIDKGKIIKITVA